MRSIRNALSDPGLHILVIAALLIGLALGQRTPSVPGASSRLIKCSTCHLYHYQESACRQGGAVGLAHAGR